MNVKTSLLILADGFEEIEALGTADVLRRLGLRVRLVGLSGRHVTGSHHITVETEVTFEEASFSSADALILPGGMPGAANLLASEPLKQQIGLFTESGKIVAAICAAPAVLKAAGVAEGRRITGYPGCEKLAGGGFSFSEAMVERDGNIITGKGPGATFLFAAEIARALGCTAEETDQVLKSMFAALS